MALVYVEDLLSPPYCTDLSAISSNCPLKSVALSQHYQLVLGGNLRRSMRVLSPCLR
jgi:hypothetical protein